MTSITESGNQNQTSLHHFYSEEPLDELISLGTGESMHAIRVLRLRKGDPVSVTDGTGIIGYGILAGTDPARCSVKIREIVPGPDRRDYRLHLAISPLTSIERLEWFVEKAVEIGTDEITPVISAHTVKMKLRTDRLRKIVISAMKQSLKTYLTIINEPILYQHFIAAPHRGIKLIAYCGHIKKSNIRDTVERGKDCLIMTGPEGDFSQSEIEEAIIHGFKPVTLGLSRLRTETAGVVACHSVYFMNL